MKSLASAASVWWAERRKKQTRCLSVEFSMRENVCTRKTFRRYGVCQLFSIADIRVE